MDGELSMPQSLTKMSALRILAALCCRFYPHHRRKIKGDAKNEGKIKEITKRKRQAKQLEAY